MSQVWVKSVLFAAATGLLLQAFTSDTSAATINVKANISFERAINFGKRSDVIFGEVQAQPNDKITMDTAGNMRLDGKGEVLAPYGRPSVMTIGDSRGQIMNFLPANYRLGSGIRSLQAHCVLKGTENGDCDNVPIYGKRETTVFIGMDITVADALSSADAARPSFDMSIVYQ